MEDSKTDKRLEAARDLNDWMSWYMEHSGW